MAELILHREPDEVSRGANYDICRKFLLKRFGSNTENYDVVCGWRADDSYFQVATRFLSDGLALPLLEEALCLGELGIQYCCRSRKAFDQLSVSCDPEPVDQSYRDSYFERDSRGRRAFTELYNSSANSVLANRIVLSDLVKSYIKSGGNL